MLSCTGCAETSLTLQQNDFNYKIVQDIFFEADTGATAVLLKSLKNFGAHCIC